MPTVFKQLPRHLRWRLGREVRNRLAAGYEPEQILDVLQAPLPPDVERPWRLALWRLSHNMTGAGPRLRPLQRQWDSQAAEERRHNAKANDQRWYEAVTSVTDPRTRRELLAALTAKVDCEIRDERRGLAHVGRMAVRQFGEDIKQALRLWLGTWAPAAAPVASEAFPAPTSDPCDDLTCVACQQVHGVVREALPLRSAVCDGCWTALADPELVFDDNATHEEIPA